MPRKGPRPRRVTVVRYLDPDGRQVPKGTPGARRVSARSDTYYATLRGAGGRKRRVSLHTADEGEAWAELRRLLRRRAEEAAGVADPALDAAARPLAGHLDDWLASVRDRGQAGEKHLRAARKQVETLAALAGWRRLGDLTEDSCAAALARLGREPGRGTSRAYGGRGACTRNQYLARARQFVRWAVRTGRLARDPLLGLARVPEDADRRHDRRCPTDEEVAALLGWLAGDGAAVVRGGLDGRSRSLAYQTAMATGFRAAEVRSLSKESFDLAKGTVTVAAAFAKAGRTDVQPLPGWLLARLRDWLPGAPQRPWAALTEDTAGNALRADLAAAGVPYTLPGPDGRPRFLDWHSTRVWYITQLANTPGITPKALMSLARHTTPQLTMRVYAKPLEEENRRVAQTIPEPGKKKRRRP